MKNGKGFYHALQVTERGNTLKFKVDASIVRLGDM